MKNSILIGFAFVLSGCMTGYLNPQTAADCQHTYGAYKTECLNKLAHSSGNQESVSGELIELMKSRYPVGESFFAGQGATGFITGEKMLVTGYAVSDMKCFPGIMSDVFQCVLRLTVMGKQNGNDKQFTKTFHIDATTPISLTFQSPDFSNPSSGPVFFKADPLKQYRGNQKVVTAVNAGKVYVGMPEDAAVISWGSAERVNIGQYGKRTSKQFVYGRDYIYTDGGKVTSWQRF